MSPILEINDLSVAYRTPGGDVQFSDAEDITGDMKQAFAQNIGILFPDNSRTTLSLKSV